MERIRPKLAILLLAGALVSCGIAARMFLTSGRVDAPTARGPVTGAELSPAADVPSAVDDIFRRALADAAHIGPVSCADIRIVIATDGRSETDWDTCTVSISEADASNQSSWWLDYVIRHEVAHLLTPYQGHDAAFRSAEAKMMTPADLELVYASAGDIYPTIWETTSGRVLATGGGCDTCLVTIR